MQQETNYIQLANSASVQCILDSWYRSHTSNSGSSRAVEDRNKGKQGEISSEWKRNGRGPGDGNPGPGS